MPRSTFHRKERAVLNVMAVTLHTTAGDIKIELFCQECPKTCENFLALCASDYYKDNIFHRNIKDFMVQTGDPTGTGKGGNSIWGGPFEDELSVELRHEGRGIVSMANNGPNTNKSQFFITYAKQPHLDLKYTIFGKVIDGFDALDELETIKVDAKYRPVVEQRFRPLSTSQEKIEAQKSKIKQSQEYFDQYIEEYYDYDEEEEDTPVKHEVVEEQLNVESLDDLVSLLRRERAYDIVVIALGADGPGIVDTMVICTPFNTRHGAAVAEVLRKAGKQTDEQPRKYTVRHNFGWFQIELGKIQVHVMGEETRQRFDLETLWGVNDVVEEEEDIPLIPPPKEKSS
ncbi:putative iojap-like protein [Necator americanus]|uniref:peptidylprolyl isomerase n=1 Tax=Necator americanus TaxID=51031 RepID=W2TE68_NECAM|nr:putative iojap-like protein [Necator americanus]ETN80340.1 putative iojap-like protein [Necator americanus]